MRLVKLLEATRVHWPQRVQKLGGGKPEIFDFQSVLAPLFIYRLPLFCSFHVEAAHPAYKKTTHPESPVLTHELPLTGSGGWSFMSPVPEVLGHKTPPLGAPGIATGSKDATRGSWPYY